MSDVVDAVLERADGWIVDRPRAVIVAFVLVTAVFAGGLGGISTEAGTSQFLDGVPAQEALEDVNEQFVGSTFGGDTGTTQLIQRDQNVLSKPGLVRMLELQERISQRPDLRVSGSSSAAGIVATQLDPDATTTAAQIRVIERSSPAEIDAAVRRAAERPGFASLLSDDFNPEAASASATIGVVEHDLPVELSSSGTSSTSPLTPIQQEIDHIAASSDGEFTVFGSGLVAAEFGNVVGDSLAIVVPAAAVLILAFLVFAYRDPVDLLIGVISLVMALVWTFGFMGLVGIPFGQMLISVPVLLLAVGIDFGIHTVNRYREERVTDKGIHESMRVTTDQLLVAFFIVTGTTVVGFGANGISDLGPIRNFGIVAAIGIVFTFLIFGVFVPAVKVEFDELRERIGFPEFGSRPLGSEDSLLGRSLGVGNVIAKRGPRAFLALTLIVSLIAGGYGMGLDTSFSQDDFLPPEELPAYVEALPEPFAPGEYTVTGTINFLEDNFDTYEGNSVTVYVEGPLRQDDALEQIHDASQDPPETFVARDREAEAQSIVTVVRSYAEQDPQFAALVERNDLNDNGVPDDNLEVIYDYLLDSPARAQATRYIEPDYSSTRIVYTTEGDAEQAAVSADARSVAEEYRLGAIATGQVVVFEAISGIIFDSAIRSLLLALGLTAVFLIVIYRVLGGRASLGIVNLVPIVVTIALLAGTMRLLGIPLNALTATILSIAIGLGIDYSAHIVHRFGDEFDESGDLFDALDRTVRGTGGALAGSMLTTTTGTAVLALAITPILGQFGLVIALSVFLSFITAVVVTPSVAVVWHQVMA
ncbi:RND family transporter [Salinirubellus sp. GCM10025818]|uniref:efflux RND transporter permease subunit n=1 Tax=Salinirubellus TaxID=2162630 RepID=UPI0030CFB069